MGSTVNHKLLLLLTSSIYFYSYYYSYNPNKQIFQQQKKTSSWKEQRSSSWWLFSLWLFWVTLLPCVSMNMVEKETTSLNAIPTKDICAMVPMALINSMAVVANTMERSGAIPNLLDLVLHPLLKDIGIIVIHR